MLGGRLEKLGTIHSECMSLLHSHNGILHSDEAE